MDSVTTTSAPSEHLRQSRVAFRELRIAFIDAWDNLFKKTSAKLDVDDKLEKANLKDKRALSKKDIKLLNKNSALRKKLCKLREALDGSMVRFIGALMDKTDRSEEEQKELVRTKRLLRATRQVRLDFIHQKTDNRVPLSGSFATMSCEEMSEIQRLQGLLHDPDKQAVSE